jgi:hypothetical protein
VKRFRWAVAAVGVAMGLYGGWLLGERPDDLLAIGTWLAGGVLLHDGVLAPLVIGICLVGARLLPDRFRASAVISLAVFGSLTLIAVPVLGRFGAKPDNPTLLDRNYLVGWLVFGALIVVGSLWAGGGLGRRPAVAGTAAREIADEAGSDAEER